MLYLLERIANPALPTSEQIEYSAPANLVAAQIQRIVSARMVQGKEDALSLLDFGMPHVAEQGLHDQLALQRFAARLTRLIERYEPRLLRPKVSLRRTNQALNPFQLVVTGQLAVDGEAEHFYFDLPQA